MQRSPLLYRFYAELVTNLLHWQWVVIIEKRHEDVDPYLAESLLQKNISIMCLTAESEYKLQKLVRFQRKISVLLFPSPENPLDLYINKSHNIEWVILLNNSYSANFSVTKSTPYLQNNHILFILQKPNNTFIIQAFQIPSGTLTTVNTWKQDSGFANRSTFLECTTQPMVTLRIAMEKHFPFYRLGKGIEKPTGVDIRLIDSLAKTLKFKYKIIRSIDRSWGNYNGTAWSGMIGMLIRNDADVALSGMTVTYDRYRSVRFSIPYAFDRITFVTKKPSIKLKTWAIFWPYTPQVWVAIASSVFMVSIVMTFLKNSMKPYNKMKVRLADITLLMFQALLTQGNCDPREIRCRILMSFWWSFCITIIAGYNGSLMSFMTHPGSYPALETVLQLVEAIQGKRFAAGTIQNSADYTVFRDSKEQGLRVILKSMESDSNNLVSHDVEGLRECLLRDYAYIGGELTVKADIWDTRLFLFAHDSFLQYGYAVAFAPGFEHIGVFNRKILQLRESGVIDKWIEDIIEQNQIRNLIKGNNTRTKEEDIIHVLRVDDVQGAFALLSIGLIFASISCVAELRMRRIPLTFINKGNSNFQQNETFNRSLRHIHMKIVMNGIFDFYSDKGN